MALTRAEARLEALKLAVRPGLEIDNVLATAERYAAFIMADQPSTSGEGDFAFVTFGDGRHDTDKCPCSSCVAYREDKLADTVIAKAGEETKKGRKK